MIKSNSDHIIRVDNAAVRLATIVMTNSSGNLILSACKRNSLCTCLENENHSPNKIKYVNFSCFDKHDSKHIVEHQKSETKKCKLTESLSNEDKLFTSSNNQQQSNNQSNNQQQSINQTNRTNNDNDQAMFNQNNEINQQQANNNQGNNDNNDQVNVNIFQMPNQMVDMNNNIIEPEFMLIDENNNYIWDNENLDQQQRPQNRLPPNVQRPPNANRQQPQNHPLNNNDHTSQQNLSLLKEKLNCNKSNCTNCKPSTSQICSTQSVQIRQRKKLLELNLNKPKTSNQFHSSISDEENVIKEELSIPNYHMSTHSDRRKKSTQCKKCSTKHLTKYDHYHSIDCSNSEVTNDLKKVDNFYSKTKASTPITLFPIMASSPTIKEKLIVNVESSRVNCEIDEIKPLIQSTRSATNNSSEQSQMTSQCPICLSMAINEPCKPNNCSHNFCQVCVIEWAKVSSLCPLCRKPFTALLSKNGLPLQCSINLQSDHDINIELSQSTLENIPNLDDINWPIIASAFLNNQTEPQGNMIDQQQCEQINSILNSVFGHLEPQNMDLQWPF